MEEGIGREKEDASAGERVTAFHLSWRRGATVILGLLLTDAIAFEFLALLEEVSDWAQLVVDGLILTVLMVPMFYFMVVRPFQENIRDFTQLEARLRQARANLTAKVKAKTAALHTANAALEARVQAQAVDAEDQRLLAEMSEMLQSCATVEEAYNVFAEFARRLCPDSSGVLAILAASRNYLETVSTWGAGPHATPTYTPDECWALRRGAPYASDAAFPMTTCRHTETKDGQHYLCIPLNAQGEAIGVLNVTLDKEAAASAPGVDHARVERLYKQMAYAVAIAVANLRLRETLHNQSVRDGLTDLFNRRYLEELLERELQRAARGGTGVVVVMIDVDHFKQFNDTYGHSAGDTVLKAVAQVLQQGIRASDVACRYGGEEFTLVMPEAPVDFAERRCNEIRAAVEQLALEEAGQKLRTITISMGIAAYPAQGDTPEALLQRADEALYQAKASGRNQVALAAAPVRETPA